MPDLLNENGLQVKTSNEIQEELETNYKSIYGQDINLASNTADGQMIGILTQANADIRELITDVYNSFNPDMVRGSVQDVRYEINNLTRKGGTFTIVPLTLEIKSTVTLNGLDSDYNDVTATAYGASDNNGNQYFLIDTATLEAGTHTLPFRSQNVGLVQPVIGTITNQIYQKTEVISIINDTAPTSLGVDEETDEEFALRRERSLENRSQNSIDSMRGQILELDGVTDAYVYNHDYDNYPTTVDSNGIPPHYIWVIVEGGANTDIATIIYSNSGGAGMKGDVSVDTVTASGQTFVAKFDRVTAVPLYIRFDIQETSKGTIFDMDGIKEYIANNLIYSIDEFAETSKPTEVARQSILANGGNGVPVNLEISLDGSEWVDYIPSQAKDNKFTVDTNRITITEINL